MRLTVNTSVGGSLSVQIEAYKKPDDVLQILAAENGLCTVNVFLVHKGRVLTNDKTLEMWGVVPDDTLYTFKNLFPYLNIPSEDLLSIKVQVFVQLKDNDMDGISIALCDRIQTIYDIFFQGDARTLSYNGVVLNPDARLVECGINDGSILVEH